MIHHSLPPTKLLEFVSSILFFRAFILQETLNTNNIDPAGTPKAKFAPLKLQVPASDAPTVKVAKKTFSLALKKKVRRFDELILSTCFNYMFLSDVSGSISVN